MIETVAGIVVLCLFAAWCGWVGLANGRAATRIRHRLFGHPRDSVRVFEWTANCYGCGDRWVVDDPTR